MALSVVGTPSVYDNSGSLWSNQSMVIPAGTTTGDITIVELTFWANGSSPVGNPLGITGATFSEEVAANFDSESWKYIWVEEWASAPPANITVGRTGAGDQYGTAHVITYRGSSALTLASVTEGSFTDDTTIEAPSVSGTANQGLICSFSQDDPSTLSAGPSGMTQAVAAEQNTESQWVYYQTLVSTGLTGTKTVAINTARGNYGVSILVDGAASGGGGGSGGALYHYMRMKKT